MEVELTINLVLDGQTEAVLEGYVLPVGVIRARIRGQKINSDTGQWARYESAEYIVTDRAPFDQLRDLFHKLSGRYDYRDLRFAATVSTNWAESPALDLLGVMQDKFYPPTNT